MDMRKAAEDYFSQLNPMATRMCADMKETKMAYQELWDTISLEEQEHILNEAIIKPEVLKKYCTGDNQSEIEQNKEFAVKFILDESFSYHDEHSGPFTFRTPSQRDLRLFTNNNNNTREYSKNTFENKPPKTTVAPKKQEESKNDIFTKEGISYTKMVDIDEVDSPKNNIPLTGLDFLDNW